MKTTHSLSPCRTSAKRTCVILCVIAFITLVHHDLQAVAVVDLGTANSFAFLAGSGITVAGAINTTVVNGSIGTYPTTSITGLSNISLSGVNNAGNAVTQTAKSDLLTAYTSAAGRAADVSYGPGHDFGGQTLVAGVYNSSSTLAITGTVTLDAQGDPSAIWIFQAGSSLTTASNSSVVLIGGAQACNVFWVIGSSATLGTGTDFQGNILAFASISLTTGVTVDGRVLALNGAVTLDTNTLMLPVCAVVINGNTTLNNPMTVNDLNLSNLSNLQVTSEVTVMNGIFNVANGVATINGGKVLAPGDFFKNGAGTLVANTLVQVNGNAYINQGALFVNGTFEAHQVNVMPQGVLGGTGDIIGNVVNAGVVTPGTLSIHGNYTQTQGGTLAVSTGDLLIVSGRATLAGTLDARGLGSSHLAFGDQVLVIKAGSIQGNFDIIDMPNSDTLRGRFLTEGGLGILLVAPTSYTLVAQTPNQTEVARALDQWIGIETGDVGEVTLALDVLTAEQYPAAFEALMPSTYGAALTTGIELSQNEGQLLFQQLSARHLNQRQKPAKTQPYEAPMFSGGKGAKNVVAAGIFGPAEIVSDQEEYRWTTWIQASGMFSSGGMSLNGDQNFETGTILVGLDYAVTDHFAVGVFTGYQEGWSDFDHGGSLDMKSVRFGIYAAVDWGGFYANAAVGGGSTDYSVNREIQWATLDRSTRSEPHGNEFFAMLGTGYDFHAGNFTFGPSASVQYSRIKLDSFVEHGAGVLDLQVSDAEAESLRTYLGGRVAYTMKVSDRVTLVPELRLFWQHEFLDGGTHMNAAFDGGRGPGFGYQMNGIRERDALYAGLGIGMHVGNRFTTSLYYNASFGRHDADQQSLTLVVEWRF